MVQMNIERNQGVMQYHYSLLLLTRFRFWWI